MKKLKKIFAVMLSLAMVLGMSLTTFAAEKAAANTADDKGTITVSGITKEDGISVQYYQIVEAKYDATTGKFTKYEVVDAYKNIIPSLTEVDGEITFTESQLGQIQAMVSGTTGATMSPVGDDYVANNVAVGSYLVVVKNAEEKIYSPVVVSVKYKSDNGSYVVDGSVDVAAVADGNAWIKVTNTPTIEKKVNGGAANTANIGDKLDFEISVPSIPYYGGAEPVFNVADTLKGLEYVPDSIRVQVKNGSSDWVDLDASLYTHTPADNTVNVDFVKTNSDGTKNYTLKDYQGQALRITYKAEVTNDALINQDPKTNNAVLNYTKDSTKEGSDDSDDSTTKTYTFDISGNLAPNLLQKIGVGDDANGLGGAEFTITNADGTAYTTNPALPGGKVISDPDGKLYIKGLAAGMYYIEETKAPDGYSINPNKYEIVIEANMNAAKDALESWSITINGKKTAEGETETTTAEFTVAQDMAVNDSHFAIPNTKLSGLPSTGGIGTTIFTIGGCAIMIIAAGLFFASRRKSAK